MNSQTKMRIRSITLEELKSCPKHILSAAHWTPVHKVEECGANEVREEENRIEVKIPKLKSKKHKHPMFTDIEKQCVECQANFIWTAGEQKFMNRLYDEGKIPSIIEPKRCPACRKKKKARIEARQNQGRDE